MCPGWRDSLKWFILPNMKHHIRYLNGVRPFSIRAKCKSSLCKKEKMAGTQCGKIVSPPRSRSAALNHLATWEKGEAESHRLYLWNGTERTVFLLPGQTSWHLTGMAYKTENWINPTWMPMASQTAPMSVGTTVIIAWGGVWHFHYKQQACFI